MSSDRARTEVLCIGETMALLAPDPPAPLARANQLRLSSAGAESNVAAWLSALGTSTQWCGRVGADPLGERVLAELAGHGIGLAAARVDKSAPTAVFFKDPAPAGSRVWYYRRGSAGSRLDCSDVDAGFSLGPRLVHLSGITPALSGSAREAVDYALTEARRRAITVSFDVNHRPALWPEDGTAGEALAALAARADLVFVGRDEAARLWGTDTAADVRQKLPEVAMLIVKDAAVEACAFRGDEMVRVPAVPAEVIEPVGAGDAFAAGFLRGYLTELPVPSCLRLGHLVAGYALTSVADVPPGALTVAELEARARNWRAG